MPFICSVSFSIPFVKINLVPVSKLFISVIISFAFNSLNLLGVNPSPQLQNGGNVLGDGYVMTIQKSTPGHSEQKK
jgi:hypothetical protein